MTGKTQKEAATILRNIPAGTRVKIIVSRQEEYKDFALPRVMVSTFEVLDCASLFASFVWYIIILFRM